MTPRIIPGQILLRLAISLSGGPTEAVSTTQLPRYGLPGSMSGWSTKRNLK